MANVRQDNVQIKLEIDGSQSRTELDNLTRKAQVLQDGFKGLKKGSEEYVAQNKELSQVRSRMEELRNEIGLTSLSSGQLKAMSSQLNRELSQLTPNTESFLNKAQELAKVDARLGQVRLEAKGVKDELDNAGGGMLSFIGKAAGFAGIQLGVQAVVSGIINLGKESVAEFAQAQGAVAQLEASLNSTSNAAGLTKEELLKISSDLEGKTILDGDNITQAQSVLLGFKNIKKGIYEDAVPAIVDMATKLAGGGEVSLEAATLQVGKALENPIQGITALSKAGVSFSEEQKAMIKTLVETGDVAGAQAIILKELGSEFGGSAEAAAKAGTGPLKQFQVQIGNVKEGLGELIVEGLQAIRPALAAGVSLFAFFIELLKGTPAFLSENKAALVGLGVAILTLNAEQVILNGLVLYQAVVERGRAAATIASATAQRLLNGAMTANPIGLVIAAVALLVGGFITLYERSEKVREVIAGLAATAKSVFTSMKEVVVNQLGSVATLLAGIFTFNPALIKKGLDALGPALSQAGTDAASAYRQGYAVQEAKEQLAQVERDKKAQELKAQRASAAASKLAAADATANLEALKNREANIKAALALVASGSAEELRLKKLEVATKRDIDLLDEKKTAGDKKVIRAEALRDLRQLQDDFDKKGLAAAEKRAKGEAEVAKRIADLKAGLLADETEKRIVQLTAAAEKEKATAQGTAEQIAEQRKLIDQKLAVDLAAERSKQALKEAQEALDIEKQRNGLMKDEWERRAADLRTTAASEQLKVLGSDANAAEKRRLIQARLQRDLQSLEAGRVEQQLAVAERIVAIDQDIALRRLSRRRQESAEFSQERARADADELAVRKQQLDAQFAVEVFQAGLTEAEKLAIARKYLDNKEALEQEYAGRARDREKAGAELGLGIASQGLQTLADFSKIDSDKELARIEKSKKQRLASLDAEYKAGRISKEAYESQKASIEANYDAQTRRVKKDAAEKEKALNIAQAIIATALSVIKASPNIPLMVAAGVTGALATAKIIATPIPEFARGGVVGAPRPTWREQVRRFAQGGINPVAGVPTSGQLHGNGGIRMVDGATGEHLGEWERGEPYMILSRDTYANNRELVDDLLDTSMHRGGAPVRRRDGGHYAEGGTPGGSLPATTGQAAGNDELLQVARETRDAVRALPSRQYIAWGNEDTANVEEQLSDRQDVRDRSGIS